MRSRNIKPGFFKNEEVAGMPFEARLLFIGLWCMADREGRMEDRPKRIKAEIFPYEAINVEKLLDVITCHGFILRYQSHKKRYIQIINFPKHQHPHPHEIKSEIPPYVITSNDMSVTNPSDVLIPDVLIPDSLPPADDLPHGAFEKIWIKYPRRDGKKESMGHFRSSVRTKKDWEDIQNALDCYLRHLSVNHTEAKYFKKGSTWFNNWRDWINYAEVSHAPNGSSSFSHYDAVARRNREIEGLRKVDHGGLGPLLAGIRTGPLPEKTADKPNGQ